MKGRKKLTTDPSRRLLTCGTEGRMTITGCRRLPKIAVLHTAYSCSASGRGYRIFACTLGAILMAGSVTAQVDVSTGQGFDRGGSAPTLSFLSGGGGLSERFLGLPSRNTAAPNSRFVLPHTDKSLGSLASPDERAAANSYGMPGLIDMPAANGFPDGEIIGTVSTFAGLTRFTLSFQIAPRIT
ncbi:MAG: YjbH domain-containing protein, partial [Pseudomonadota bacterium]